MNLLFPGFSFRPWLVTAALLCLGATARAETRLSDYVRPFVGTQGEGNTFPGPSAPFGMVQLSPDTDEQNWDTDSGYEYSDPTILGFSLTHLSGTGCPDLGDFLFTPQVGPPVFVPGTKDHPESGYQSAFSHADEAASAGYYRVKLRKPGVLTELTAGERAGILRFTFPASDEASILTDLSRVIDGKRWHVLESHVRVEDGSTITGFHLVNGWAKERSLYFAARFSRPFDEGQIIKDGEPVTYGSYVNYRFRSRREAAGTNLQFLARYKTHADEAIQVKVAVSAVSAANALQNLDGEIPDWDFERVKEATRARWDQELGRMTAEGSDAQKETFYTSLYHALLTPNLYEDVNGEYRGFDQNIHQAKEFTAYTVFSLWDTFRAEHPLLSLIQAPRDADMINSLLAHYDQSADGLLPMWELQGNETWCMIGYHAAPVIADGFLNGGQGFRRRARLRGHQGDREQPGLRRAGLLPQAGLGAVRRGGRIALEDAGIRLRRLDHCPNGEGVGQTGGLRGVHAARRELQEPLRSGHRVHAVQGFQGALATRL